MGGGILTVTDVNELDQQLGAEAGFVQLNSELAQADLHLIVDLNPNQMSATHENAWWFDALEWGHDATHARHFDIDWAGPITLPVLDRPISEEVDAGKFEISFNREKAGLGVTYGWLFYPLATPSYRRALEGVHNRTAISFIETASEATPSTSASFHADLSSTFDRAQIADRLDIASALNAIAGDLERLAGLMSLQNWRLVESEGMSTLINYRHSADSNLIVGLRIEDPGVFEDFHEAALSLLDNTQVRGFRVNDIDGLADPTEYTARLRREAGEDAFLVTDRMLLGGEKCNRDCKVNGTAGHEFISITADLFVNRAGLSELQLKYDRELGPRSKLPGEYHLAKANILHDTFPDELSALARLLAELEPSYAEEYSRRAIAELVLELPIYRACPQDGISPAVHHHALQLAVAQLAGREGQTVEVAEIQAFVVRVLSEEHAQADADIAVSFRIRFQQLTAAVMRQAIQKSYRYAHLPIALDELMLSCTRTLDPVHAFHEKMIERASTTPSGLLATSFAHATKFGEDARMRLLAKWEAPDYWARAVDGWRQRHAGNLATIEDLVVPDPHAEWLIYQTLVAIWPASLRIDDTVGIASIREELVAFMGCAIREKQSFWTGINKPYERAVINYLDRMFENKGFLSDFVETMKPFWLAGALNSFAQTVLKLTAPGVPVIHNGSEAWDLFVSPSSSRHPVNFEDLKNQLANAEQSNWRNGSVRIFETCFARPPWQHRAPRPPS